MSAAAQFQRALGAELTTRLGSEYAYLKSRLMLRRSIPCGTMNIILAGSNKWSPLVDVAFYFGINFSKVAALEKKHGLYRFLMHIQQYSYNCRVNSFAAYTGPCSWEVDLRRPPKDLVGELAVAVRGLAYPFADKYGSLLLARDAIADSDPFVFGGQVFWRQLLYLDMALGDLEHFRDWSKCLDALRLSQAEEIIRKISN